MPGSSLVRCAIYTRQSVARPGRDATLASCALQRAACLGLIASNTHLRWTPVLEHFDDEGESGATTDRPALDRLVDAIADGRIDRVVVHRLDRLTRRVLDWARIQHAFRAHGVAISVVQGDLHGTNDAITQLRLNTLAIFAEFERDMIAERLRDARAARRARGLRVAGQLPLGYVADPATRQLVVAPEEAEIVRRMFADAAEGALPAAIAARANEVGTVDKNGKTGRWGAKAVLRILRNPTYVGLLADGTRGVHAAVVSRDLFDRVAATIEGRRTRPPTPRPEVEGAVDPFLLRGLLVCVGCGRRMTTSSTGKVRRPQWNAPHQPETGTRYYRCRGPSPCPSSQVAARVIEGYMPKLFVTPPLGMPEHVRATFVEVSRAWEALMLRNRRRVLVSLCREIRWDGARSAVALVVDEEGVTNWIEGWNRASAAIAAT
jgi:DNA invertase Pin-like site-specific DNA recombinase